MGPRIETRKPLDMDEHYRSGDGVAIFVSEDNDGIDADGLYDGGYGCGSAFVSWEDLVKVIPTPWMLDEIDRRTV